MEWVIPCNEKYYDHRGAFANLNTIDWRQSTKVEVGDYVYIYVGRPTSSLMYKCEAIAVDIENPSNDDAIYNKGGLNNAGRYMRLKLIESYPEGKYKREDLLENGLKTVQGPTKATPELIAWLEK